MQRMQVALLGLDSVFGRMSSLFLKQSKSIQNLRLYDDANVSSARDIAIINSSCKVQSFLGKDALGEAVTGADLVIIGDVNFSTPHTSFELMAPKISEYAKAVAEHSPHAIVVIAASPVNSLVPLFSEALQRWSCYDCNRVVGATEVDSARANCILASHLGVCPHKVTLPVIGGASRETRVPLLSHSMPSVSLSKEITESIVKCIKESDSAVFAMKSPEALNKAFTTVRFLNKIISGMQGKRDGVAITFCRTHYVPGAEYFSLPVQFGRYGIRRRYPIPNISSYEQTLVNEAIVSLKNDVEKAKRFIDNLFLDVPNIKVPQDDPQYENTFKEEVDTEHTFVFPNLVGRNYACNKNASTSHSDGNFALKKMLKHSFKDLYIPTSRNKSTAFIGNTCNKTQIRGSKSSKNLAINPIIQKISWKTVEEEKLQNLIVQTKIENLLKQRPTQKPIIKSHTDRIVRKYSQRDQRPKKQIVAKCFINNGENRTKIGLTTGTSENKSSLSTDLNNNNLKSKIDETELKALNENMPSELNQNDILNKFIPMKALNQMNTKSDDSPSKFSKSQQLSKKSNLLSNENNQSKMNSNSGKSLKDFNLIEIKESDINKNANTEIHIGHSKKVNSFSNYFIKNVRKQNDVDRKKGICKIDVKANKFNISDYGVKQADTDLTSDFPSANLNSEISAKESERELSKKNTGQENFNVDFHKINPKFISVMSKINLIENGGKKRDIGNSLSNLSHLCSPPVHLENELNGEIGTYLFSTINSEETVKSEDPKDLSDERKNCEEANEKFVLLKKQKVENSLDGTDLSCQKILGNPLPELFDISNSGVELSEKGSEAAETNFSSAEPKLQVNSKKTDLKLNNNAKEIVLNNEQEKVCLSEKYEENDAVPLDVLIDALFAEDNIDKVVEMIETSPEIEVCKADCECFCKPPNESMKSSELEEKCVSNLKEETIKLKGEQIKNTVELSKVSNKNNEKEINNLVQSQEATLNDLKDQLITKPIDIESQTFDYTSSSNKKEIVQSNQHSPSDVKMFKKIVKCNFKNENDLDEFGIKCKENDVIFTHSKGKILEHFSFDKDLCYPISAQKEPDSNIVQPSTPVEVQPNPPKNISIFDMLDMKNQKPDKKFSYGETTFFNYIKKNKPLNVNFSPRSINTKKKSLENFGMRLMKKNKSKINNSLGVMKSLEKEFMQPVKVQSTKSKQQDLWSILPLVKSQTVGLQVNDLAKSNGKAIINNGRMKFGKSNLLSLLHEDYEKRQSLANKNSERISCSSKSVSDKLFEAYNKSVRSQLSKAAMSYYNERNFYGINAKQLNEKEIYGASIKSKAIPSIPKKENMQALENRTKEPGVSSVRTNIQNRFLGKNEPLIKTESSKANTGESSKPNAKKSSNVDPIRITKSIWSQINSRKTKPSTSEPKKELPKPIVAKNPPKEHSFTQSPGGKDVPERHRVLSNASESSCSYLFKSKVLGGSKDAAKAGFQESFFKRDMTESFEKSRPLATLYKEYTTKFQQNEYVKGLVFPSVFSVINKGS